MQAGEGYFAVPGLFNQIPDLHKCIYSPLDTLISPDFKDQFHLGLFRFQLTGVAVPGNAKNIGTLPGYRRS